MATKELIVHEVGVREVVVDLVEDELGQVGLSHVHGLLLGGPVAWLRRHAHERLMRHHGWPGRA